MPAKKESGTVTAELVLTLPVVTTVLAIAMGLLSVQLTRIELVSEAANIARAIARGEPMEYVDSLVSNLGEGINFEIEEPDGLICVILKSEIEILDVDLSALELVETQCAKAQGQ